MHVPCDGARVDDGVETFANGTAGTVHGEEGIDGRSESEG